MMHSIHPSCIAIHAFLKPRKYATMPKTPDAPNEILVKYTERNKEKTQMQGRNFVR
tara:strand:+ start:1229 stop:1396 length:168 start_codon:yes stop_codon:yes gene_type:complete